MRFTPKQREKIYRKAAENIFYKKNRFCCPAIRSAANIRHFEKLEDDFPEIFNFKFKSDFEHNNMGLWWGDWSVAVPIYRILALLFAAEMTKKQ